MFLLIKSSVFRMPIMVFERRGYYCIYVNKNENFDLNIVCKLSCQPNLESAYRTTARVPLKLLNDKTNSCNEIFLVQLN